MLQTSNSGLAGLARKRLFEPHATAQSTLCRCYSQTLARINNAHEPKYGCISPDLYPRPGEELGAQVYKYRQDRNYNIRRTLNSNTLGIISPLLLSVGVNCAISYSSTIPLNILTVTSSQNTQKAFCFFSPFFFFFFFFFPFISGSFALLAAAPHRLCFPQAKQMPAS